MIGAQSSIKKHDDVEYVRTNTGSRLLVNTSVLETTAAGKQPGERSCGETVYRLIAKARPQLSNVVQQSFGT